MERDGVEDAAWLWHSELASGVKIVKADLWNARLDRELILIPA
jgi:hypothetical protein